MATPPTLVATFGNNPIVNTYSSSTPRTVSLSVQAGDLIVVKANSRYNGAANHIQTPTGGGLTYTLQQSIEDVAGHSNAYIWTATSPTTQTFTLSILGGNYVYWTFEVKVWRNHGGVGTSAKKYASATTSLSMTTTGDNSAVELLDVDYSAKDGTSRAWLTSAGAFTESTYQYNSGVLTVYAGHHADVGALGSKTFGMSAPAAQVPSLIAVEVLAAPVVVATGSLSITATALPGNTPPAIEVDINDTRSPGAASQLTIMRINPDGSSSPVRTTDGNPLQLASGVGTVYDYEMPLGQLVSYTTLEVPGVTSLQTSVDAPRPWLVHPGVPDLSVQLGTFMPGSFTKRTRPVTQGVFQVMSRENPVVVTDGVRKGIQSSFSVLVTNANDLDAIDTILSGAATLLLNISPSLGFTFPTCYIAVGPVDYQPMQDKVFEQQFTVVMPFTVVDRPAGGSQAQRTWVDVIAAYGSWNAVMAAYRTWQDELTGP